MPKQLLFADAARRKMLEGVDILAHAVGTTLGPTGRNVILSKSFGGPTVTKDGVTVSRRRSSCPIPFENNGGQAGQRRGVEDVRHRRRRDHHRHHPRPRDLPRRLADRDHRRQPDRRPPGDREGRGSRRRRAGDDVAPGLEEGRDRAGRHDLGPTTTPRSATSSPTPWRRSAATESSPSRKARRGVHPARIRRGDCSLTRGTCPPTSSPARRRWKRSSTTP